MLGYDQPFSNHNGGWMGFGPDGFLYIASGDGGSGGDPQNNAQNLNSLLGKILRMNLDGTAPTDNPLSKLADAEPRIWAMGLRNNLGLAYDARGRLWGPERFVGQ